MSELRPLFSGRLRAAAYDEKTRTLLVEFDDGERYAYAPVTFEMWRRLTASSSPWSYFRENIEEELTPRRIARRLSSPATKNPLDDLFS